MSDDVQALVQRAFAAQQALLQASQSIAVDLTRHQAANPNDPSTLLSWAGTSLKLQAKAMEAGTLALTLSGVAMGRQFWSLGQKIPNAPSLPEPGVTQDQLTQLSALEALAKALIGVDLERRKAAIEAA